MYLYVEEQDMGGPARVEVVTEMRFFEDVQDSKRHRDLSFGKRVFRLHGDADFHTLCVDEVTHLVNEELRHNAQKQVVAK